MKKLLINKLARPALDAESFIAMANRPRVKHGVCALLLLLVLVAPIANAAPTNNAKLPIEIDADALDVLQKEQKATFSGNVVAKQGDMVIRADFMTVHYKPGGGDNAISKIDVSGGVEVKTQGELARSDSGSYNLDAETVTLNGNVVLTKDNNILKGSKLVFNIATGKSKLEKDASGRVRGLFVPE